MKKPIIGFCGQAGSGKDTAANYLITNYGYKKLALAEPIKDFSKHIFNFSEEQLWGSSSKRNESVDVNWTKAFQQLEKHGPQWLSFFEAGQHMQHLFKWLEDLEYLCGNKVSARYALQTLGTNLGRNVFGADVWVNHLIDRTIFYMSESEVAGIVVTDVRYENEINILRSNGGKIIRLLRNSGIYSGIPGHCSETEQDTLPSYCFDLVLNNNFSLDNLYESLDTYMRIL